MRQVCLLSGILAVLVVFSGCSVQESDFDLIILSPHQEKIEDEFETAFSDWYQAEHGCRPRIAWRDMGGGTVTQERFIADRFVTHPEGIGIDVFFGGGLDPHIRLAEKGLLAGYRIPNLDEVAPDILGTPIYDEGFHYYGAALSGFGVIYNRTLLKEMKLAEPTSWEALARPELKGAPHMETAREFVAFVMSQNGQRLWFLPPGVEGGPRRKALYRMPVIPSLYERYASTAVVEYNPFTFTKSFRHDAALATRRRDIFRNLFLATLIRPHSELQAAWGEVMKVADNEKLIVELVRPPVTEKELLDLADREWADSGRRSRLMTEWTNQAFRRYASVKAKAKAAASGS